MIRELAIKVGIYAQSAHRVDRRCPGCSIHHLKPFLAPNWTVGSTPVEEKKPKRSLKAHASDNADPCVYATQKNVARRALEGR